MFKYFNINNWLFYKYKKDNNLLKQIKLLNESQWKSNNFIKDYQERKFKEIINYAYLSSNYYHKLLDNIGLNNVEDFTLNYINKIPLLSKGIINQNLDLITCDKKGEILNQTGGSTGIPLKFYNNKKFIELDKPAANIWAYNMGGYRLGDKMAVIWGYDNDLPNKNIKQRFINKLIHKNYEINAFNLDEQIIKQFCDYLNRQKIIFIKGYANSLYEVAKYLLKNNIRFSATVKSVFSEAEVLDDEKREVIERAFKTKVFNYYGSREFGTIAVECEKHDGLHINFRQLYLEITDDGKVLVTSYLNLATPFIRYEIGDSANKIIYEKCSCGRSSPRIDKILGRESDNFLTESNKIIHGEYVTHLFYKTRSIIQFQVIQQSYRDFTMNIISNNEENTINEMDLIKKALENQFGYHLNISINFLPSIPKTKTGKLRFTIRNF